jgi:hypothetical protein
MKRILITSLLALTVLSACGKEYPFPIDPVSQEVIDQEYKGWKYTLIKNPAYHFDILVPKDWQVLQTTYAQEPTVDRPLEIAVYREPGDWMQDQKVSAEGELAIEVHLLSGSNLLLPKDKAPTDWLKERLRMGAGTYKVLQQREFRNVHGIATDMLIRTGSSQDTLISRFVVFRSPSRDDQMFVISGTAFEADYPRVADAFATAMITFKLENPEPKK